MHHACVPLILRLFYLCLAPVPYSFLQGADPAAASSAELADMSVEQLLNLKVTSVARREETIAQSPAAITVLTQEDIRRSGATSIPELLRLVPGLNVARVGVHTWAISSRGFNDVYANNLLVLIDGRSVYTPLFTGCSGKFRTPYWRISTA